MFVVFTKYCNRHFRAGAPPVINPINTVFPNSTAFSLAYNLTVSVNHAQALSVTLFNVTQPEAGDWFIAAHLPKDDGKIEQQVYIQYLLRIFWKECPDSALCQSLRFSCNFTRINLFAVI